MGFVQDVLTALDKIEAWRRLQDLPERVATLEAELAAVKAAAAAKPKGPTCPMCGSAGFIRTDSRPHPTLGVVSGLKVETWRCPACSHSETRERNESAR